MGEPISVVCGPTLIEAREALERAGYSVTIAVTDEPEALPGSAGLRVIVVDADAISDQIELAVGRLGRSPNNHVVVIASDVRPASVVAVIRAGAVDYLVREDGYLTKLTTVLESIASGSPIYNPAQLGDRFLHIMATLQHDLKNPINNMLGYVELLTENPTTKLEGEPAQFARRIGVNCMQALDVLERVGDETKRLLKVGGE